MTTALEQLSRQNEISQFLYKEARLEDEHQFADWESLWTDDAIYWVPANGDGGDPEKKMSIIYDNRSRIGLRIKQFFTGKRFSMNPRPRLRRVICNIEILGEEEGSTRVMANMILFESSRRGDRTWAARNEYLLRNDGTGWRMAYKKVNLVNNETALVTMAFLM